MKKICIYKCKQCNAILDSDGFLILPENILDKVFELKKKKDLSTDRLSTHIEQETWLFTDVTL